MLDGLRDIFLDALESAPHSKRRALVERWNKECDNVQKIKDELIREAYLSQRTEDTNA